MGLAEVDPDLGRLLLASQRACASQWVLVSAFPVPAGRWIPPVRDDSHYLGSLVIDGLIAHYEHLQDTVAQELLGPGGLIVPWSDQSDGRFLARSACWQVLDQTTLANVDRRLEQAAVRYPAIWPALLGRTSVQRARLSTHKAICQVTGVDAKPLALFWHLAEQLGKVISEGVLLPLRLPPPSTAPTDRDQTIDGDAGTEAADRFRSDRSGARWRLDPRPGTCGGQNGQASAVRLRQSARRGRSPLHAAAPAG